MAASAGRGPVAVSNSAACSVQPGDLDLDLEAPTAAGISRAGLVKMALCDR
jgi:hypothetical protein